MFAKVKIYLFPLLLLLWACAGTERNVTESPRLVGGPCEGCEAIFEYGNRRLTATDTLPGFQDADTKIKVSGTVYNPDGETPAAGVILYVYHTNAQGIYPTLGTETGWAKRHGYLRGWVKTDEQGRYTFYTQQPGSYPSRTDPAHIHLTLLEPDGKYYWADNYHFKGDSLLTQKEVAPEAPRAGSSGLLVLKKEGDEWVGARDLILGRNIPDYD